MRWDLDVIAPPSVEPVSLAEAKAHLRVDNADEDGQIESLIRSARRLCEEAHGRAYVTQRLRLYLERWPRGRRILLPRPPLQSVEAVKYVNSKGQAVTVDPSTYRVVTASEPGAIVLAPGQSWPSEELDAGLPITVDYTAGYSDLNLPEMETARQAIKLLIGHWYENREAVVTGAVGRAQEFSLNSLLSIDRVWYPKPDPED